MAQTSNSCSWEVDPRGLGFAGYPPLHTQLGTDWPWLSQTLSERNKNQNMNSDDVLWLMPKSQHLGD